VTYYNGDPNNNDGWGAYPSIPETMDFFVNLFDLVEEEVYSFEDIDPGDGSVVDAIRYGDPSGGCGEVRLYTVQGKVVMIGRVLMEIWTSMRASKLGYFLSSYAVMCPRVLRMN